MACLAIAFSAYLEDAFSALCFPICLYFLLLRVVRFPEDIMIRYPYLRVLNWVEGTCVLGSTPLICLIFKILATLILCTIFYLLVVIRLYFKWHRGV